MGGLVSLGRWLRGTNVLTGLINENYTFDKAELLNQPALVTHFRVLIAELKTDSLKEKLQEIELGLARIESVMKDNDQFSIDTVQKLHKSLMKC